MIKVLVTEDDHLVRRGLIGMMAWRKFGLEVVGEASNGEEALAFLRANPVDMILTDVAMPVMDGLRLMQETAKLYPRVAVVVLTFYEEFDYVQEALRLGALDYVTKDELEMERLDAVLERIVSRYRNRSGGGYFGSDSGCALFRLRPDRTPAFPNGLIREFGQKLAELDDGVWWLDDSQLEEEATLAAEMPPGWTVVKWSGLLGTDPQRFYRKLAIYRDRCLFYKAGADRSYCEEHANAIEEIGDGDAGKLLDLGDRWAALGWMIDDAAYAILLRDIRELSMPGSLLESFFRGMALHWARGLDIPAASWTVTLRFGEWADVVRWLDATRASVQANAKRFDYSEDVTRCIWQAAQYVQREFQADLQIADVARRVGLSRSYFSRCFSAIVGRTFHDYVTQQRLDHAKTLLAQTARSVGWIASQCGYPNEKYFSKVFREATGLRPRDYRDGQAARN